MSSLWRSKSLAGFYTVKRTGTNTHKVTHRHTPFSTQWCLNLSQYAGREGCLWWKLVQDHLGEIFCLWKQWRRVRWTLQKQNLKASLVQATTTATRQGCVVLQSGLGFQTTCPTCSTCLGLLLILTRTCSCVRHSFSRLTFPAYYKIFKDTFLSQPNQHSLIFVTAPQFKEWHVCVFCNYSVYWLVGCTSHWCRQECLFLFKKLINQCFNTKLLTLVLNIGRFCSGSAWSWFDFTPLWLVLVFHLTMPGPGTDLDLADMVLT